MRMKYVLSEVLVGLWRNVTMTIAMIITMAVSLFMLGGSGLLYQKVGDMKDLYYENVEVSIFLKTDATKEQVDALGQQLGQDPLAGAGLAGGVRDREGEAPGEARQPLGASPGAA